MPHTRPVTANYDEAPTTLFEAGVPQQGPNAYVDVPESVTRAFSAYTAAGRSRVVGTVNGVSVNATLVPVGRKGQRLYVNGGMRSAARVGVGGPLRLPSHPRGRRDALWRTLPPRWPPSTPGPSSTRSRLPTAASFCVSTTTRACPSRWRRRLLKRWITSSDGPAIARASMPTAPCETCPNCGNQFVSRNQYHSCATHTLATPFAGEPPRIRDLFAAQRKARRGLRARQARALPRPRVVHGARAVRRRRSQDPVA